MGRPGARLPPLRHEIAAGRVPHTAIHVLAAQAAARGPAPRPNSSAFAVALSARAEMQATRRFIALEIYGWHSGWLGIWKVDRVIRLRGLVAWLASCRPYLGPGQFLAQAYGPWKEAQVSTEPFSSSGSGVDAGLFARRQRRHEAVRRPSPGALPYGALPRPWGGHVRAPSLVVGGARHRPQLGRTRRRSGASSAFVGLLCYVHPIACCEAHIVPQTGVAPDDHSPAPWPGLHCGPAGQGRGRPSPRPNTSRCRVLGRRRPRVVRASEGESRV